MEEPDIYGPLSAKELNIIRGKALMSHSPTDGIWKVFGYIDWLEDQLGEADNEDMLGSEGWRHFFNHPDAD